jgi:hypothetical protein
MSTFTIILLLVILVLIASDVFFLWRIFKNIGKRKRSIPDERYFELKYNINLLKAVSAILIFLLGFLGFTTYRDITSIVESDFEERFNEQQERINQLDSIVSGYEELVETLKSTEGQSIENLNDVKREFRLINRKVAQTQDALKYSSRIYIVKGLKHYHQKSDDVTFYFNSLETIEKEKLPKFKTPPSIIIQGMGSSYFIREATTEYVTLSAAFYHEQPEYETLDLWIVEPN